MIRKVSLRSQERYASSEQTGINLETWLLLKAENLEIREILSCPHRYCSPRTRNMGKLWKKQGQQLQVQNKNQNVDPAEMIFRPSVRISAKWMVDTTFAECVLLLALPGTVQKATERMHLSLYPGTYHKRSERNSRGSSARINFKDIKLGTASNRRKYLGRHQ